MENYLDEALIKYGRSDIYPFHMPGHKRQRLGDFTPEEIDITEIDGFDNLHHAGGILREGQKRLARVFGADESFYLVNGSTAGILAAICGCMGKGGRLLIARNCHRSVYHAAYLMEARLAYLYPERTRDGILGSIAPANVEEALRLFPDTQAVVITSPTYDGVVSDIRAIANLAHERNIPLIVDEAHGAHFGFAENFPQKASALGADLCVESLHKTLPAYTQSAALHLKRTARRGADGQMDYLFDADRVRRYLDIFQSSSPSYVLMAGIDRCVRMIAEDTALYGRPETRADSLFGQFEGRLRRFYKQCEKLQTVQLLPGICTGVDNENVSGACPAGIYARDPSRILISAQAAGYDGRQLTALLLERYHLQMEMAAGGYVIALASVSDTDEGFKRLFCALEEIDKTAEQAGTQCRADRTADGAFATDGSESLYGPGAKRMELAQAMDARTDTIPLSGAAGRISAEFVCPYPPGIPVLVPGEVITDELIGQLSIERNRGVEIVGLQDPDGGKICVVGDR